MKITRRNFMKAGALAAAFAGADSIASGVFAADESFSAFAGMPDEAASNPLFYLTSEDFKKYIGKQFSLVVETDAGSAELLSVVQTVKPGKIAAQAGSGRRRKLTRETFTLSFRAAGDNFSQTTYKMWHPALGQFDLFLVPGSKEGGQTLLHAVVNRI